MRSHLAIAFAVLVVTVVVVVSALFAWKQNRGYTDTIPVSEAASSILLTSTAGEVRFSHPRHGAAGCSDCHHKSDDPNPYRSCQDCHQLQRGKITDLQTAFHQTCIQCHEKILKSGKQAPSRRCSSCHQQEGGAGK
jgi:hypothetical protein